MRSRTLTRTYSTVLLLTIYLRLLPTYLLRNFQVEELGKLAFIYRIPPFYISPSTQLPNTTQLSKLSNSINYINVSSRQLTSIAVNPLSFFTTIHYSQLIRQLRTIDDGVCTRGDGSKAVVPRRYSRQNVNHRIRCRGEVSASFHFCFYPYGLFSHLLWGF